MQYISRAGEKLDFALNAFHLSPKGFICADFGSSTGGFVGVLLSHGAQKVYSVDTAYGELAWELRNNPKVNALERTNAMHVTLPEKADLITVDTAWTKQEKVLPNALRNLKPTGQIITLIKPHYEAPKGMLQKGKLPEEKIEEILSSVAKKAEQLGLKVENRVKSPITGNRAGNTEWLFLLTPIN